MIKSIVQFILPLIIFYCLVALPKVVAQTTISGAVVDVKGQPIVGATLLIEGTYDGTITSGNGTFQFDTFESGEVVLQIAYLGYETQQITDEIQNLKNLRIKLKESVTALDAVVVSASTFKAGDNSKLAVLKPLDIVTTAGALGDVIGALQTLPGTQSNPDDGRLFVRGGEARETAIYIDGLKVFSPYIRSIGGTPTRGRYSPMLFKGVSFSTGGYSAGFGQSLSGILDMQTIDEPEVTETNIGVMTIGGMLGHTQKWDKQSLSLNGMLMHLGPYQFAFPGRMDWVDPYAGISGETVYRYHTKKGLFKSYFSAEKAHFQVSRPNIDTDVVDTIGIKNANIYSNNTYREY